MDKPIKNNSGEYVEWYGVRLSLPICSFVCFEWLADEAISRGIGYGTEAWAAFVREQVNG